jgi:hypothetical protein
MNWAHVHLALNHFPVVGAIGIALLLGLSLLRKSPELTRVSLALFVLLGLVTVLVYLTGGEAEQLVEDLPGVSEARIETHEEISLIATAVVVLGALGALGAMLRWRGPRRLPTGVLAGLFGVSLLASGLMFWTANTGGQIRHSEILPGAAARPD